MATREQHRTMFGRGTLLTIAAFTSILAVAFDVSGVQAQERLGGGLDLRLFRPATDSRGYISVDGAEVMPHNRFSFGMTLDGGFQMLRNESFKNSEAVSTENAERTDYLVDYLATGTLHVNYGLLNWVVLGVQLPFHFIGGPDAALLDNDGTPLLNSEGNGGVSAQDIGDIAFNLKVRIWRERRQRLSLAAVVQLTAPTGSSDRFYGEPGLGFWPKLVLETRPIDWFRAGLNVGYRLNTGAGSPMVVGGINDPSAADGTAREAVLREPGTRITYDDLVTFGAAAAFRVAPKVELIGEGYGTWLASAGSNSVSTSLEALAGIKIFVQESSYLMLAGGGALPPRDGFQSANYRGVFSIVYEPKAMPDRDGDGIPDHLDACPDEPEDLDGFEDADGCPDPDNDGDGIPDYLDKCPNTPEDFDGVEDEDGCPEGAAGGTRGLPGDRDGDGIPDHLDACPDDAEDFDGFQDQDGCPDLDNDGDGIPDADDQCPDDPEVYNGYQDEDGCPDEGSVLIEDGQLVILEKIYFKTASAEILPQSFPIIDAVAATLRGNPQIKRLEVQGHADERGRDDYNLQLTDERAASVVTALVDRGVQRERLRSRGYGEACPLDKASNPDAWERNRRVEFKLLETDEGPILEPVACPAGLKLYTR